MFCLLFISNLIFRQTRRHAANIFRLGAFLGPHHTSLCIIMHHASFSSSSCKLLSLCGDEMGSWIAGFAPEGGTQHDAEITLRVGDIPVGRTQFSFEKLSKIQIKVKQKSPKNQRKIPSQSDLGPSWGRLGAVLAVMEPCWAVLGPSWVVLGLSRNVLEPSLSLIHI